MTGSDEGDVLEQMVQEELRATDDAGIESDAEALVRLQAIEARVREELARYGIIAADDQLRIGAGGVEVLLRHIYNNRDVTYGAQKLSLEFLERQRNALQGALEKALAADGQSHEQAHAAVEELIRAATWPRRGCRPEDGSDPAPGE